MFIYRLHKIIIIKYWNWKILCSQKIFFCECSTNKQIENINLWNMYNVFWLKNEILGENYHVKIWISMKNWNEQQYENVIRLRSGTQCGIQKNCMEEYSIFRVYGTPWWKKPFWVIMEKKFVKMEMIFFMSRGLRRALQSHSKLSHM